MTVTARELYEAQRLAHEQVYPRQPVLVTWERLGSDLKALWRATAANLNRSRRE